MPASAAKPLFFIAALALAGVVFTKQSADAQETFQGASMSSNTATALGASAGRPDDHAIPVAGWLLYPFFSFGYVFNDNVYGRSFNRVGASGVSVRPGLEA
ncbi:MAG: hypothetical protein N2444_04410, partial [Methylocystis sp.]|nr:hypothetical protein [Methylocystis sp.]